MKSTRGDALERLMLAIRSMVEHGETVPCLNTERSWLWISDSRQAQRAAAHGCATCPALHDCREYVSTNREPAGVWAGLIDGKQVAA